MDVRQFLLENANPQLADFNKKIIPETTLPILGIKVPILRDIAKRIVKSKDLSFLNETHEYFEEFFIHGLIIAYANFDINKTIQLLNKFIPSIDNWAICDSVCNTLEVFKKEKAIAFDYLCGLLSKDDTYSKRFAIVGMLSHFIGSKYDRKIIEKTKIINTNEYYVYMAIGWLYCEMLIKNPNLILPMLEKKELCPAVQNATIKKVRESYRVSPQLKEYIKTLRL